MYAISVVPGKPVPIDPSPYQCLRLTHAVLVNPPRKGGRVVLEICPHPDDVQSDDAVHVAVASLSPKEDSVRVSIVLNDRMAIRISSKGCGGALVHVTGVKFTPPARSSMFGADPMFNSLLNGFVVESDDDDDDDYQPMLEEPQDDPQNKSLVQRVHNAIKEQDQKKLIGHDTSDDSADDDDDNIPRVSEEEIKSLSEDAPSVKPSASPEKKHPKPAVSKPEPKQKEKKSKKRPASDSSQDSVPAPGKKAKSSLPVISHRSGLRYQDTLVGVGKKVVKGHNVALQYVLRLENGKVVDKADRKRPFKFRLGVGECIKGFDIGVAGMREGGERHLIVPADLGYGDSKTPGIPPGSTLFFDVSIVKAF